MHSGQGPGLTSRSIGEVGGQETVTVGLAQTPPHRHAANCNSGEGNKYDPANDFWALDAAGAKEYSQTAGAQMAPDALAPTGGGGPHNNLQPCLAINYCIAVQGIFPSRN
jgi:microcystin-dependent protein